ncbi:MAG TPA: c-type cytochrome [Terracidiphilus sp.]|nr:c-type cytochrome [Terracidiphilus sp.]
MTAHLRAGPAIAAAALLLACCGCATMHGVPSESAEVVRPDQQLDFHVLFKQNCAGCHGDNGRGGAAMPLNNPAYLAVAGAQNLRATAAKGIPGTLMPPFAQSAGGMLTDPQVDALVQGMMHEWGRPADFSAIALPPYVATAPGNSADGQKAYTAACARCHGTDGTGIQSRGTPQHSIVDPSYLTLVNDQNLRSIVIAGHLDDNAPDWRSYVPGRALSSQEITDIVAWVGAHRALAAQQSANLPAANPTGIATKEKP